MEPGIYYDISNEAYHSGPGISKSQLDDIARSPAIFQWRKDAPVDTEKTKALDLGTDFHCAVLEPERFADMYRVGPEVNRRTTAGKTEEKEFFEKCEKDGAVPITHDDARKVELMRGSVMAHPIAKQMIAAQGHAEASIYWHDESTGNLCRCRPDKFIPDWNWIVDVKTTADMKKFRREFYDLRYHVQDAFYTDGYAAQFGERPTFVFVVTSTTIDCGRYPTEVFFLDEEAKAAGRSEYQSNLVTYSECLSRNEWPGIATLSLPHWAKELRNV